MKNIYLLIGKSGVGKTAVSYYLNEIYNYKLVTSYTTRPKRDFYEKGHIFVSKEEFDKLDLIAYTKFDKYEYGATAELVKDSDIYVIDVDGLNELKANIKDKKCVTIYLKTNIFNLIKRMRARGDSFRRIFERIKNDRKSFKDVHRINFNYILKANKSLEVVAEQVNKIIQIEEFK